VGRTLEKKIKKEESAKRYVRAYLKCLGRKGSSPKTRGKQKQNINVRCLLFPAGLDIKGTEAKVGVKLEVPSGGIPGAEPTTGKAKWESQRKAIANGNLKRGIYFWYNVLRGPGGFLATRTSENTGRKENRQWESFSHKKSTEMSTTLWCF